MPIPTEQEIQEMIECSKTFKENAETLTESANSTSNKIIKKRLESLSMSFRVNAKILDAYTKSLNPEKDKYQELFPTLQKELD